MNLQFLRNPVLFKGTHFLIILYIIAFELRLVKICEILRFLATTAATSYRIQFCPYTQTSLCVVVTFQKTQRKLKHRKYSKPRSKIGSSFTKILLFKKEKYFLPKTTCILCFFLGARLSNEIRRMTEMTKANSYNDIKWCFCVIIIISIIFFFLVSKKKKKKCAATKIVTHGYWER